MRVVTDICCLSGNFSITQYLVNGVAMSTQAPDGEEELGEKLDDLLEDAQDAVQEAALTVAEKVESAMEVMLFQGRWLLAPMYLGLIFSLLILVIKFVESFYKMVMLVSDGTLQTTTLEVLELLDITLLGNLIVIVIFSGYENFVSKINIAENSVDRPSWMGKVDYSGLKIKLIGSLVAISVIELLKDFMQRETLNPSIERWRIGIHLTFVFSGVLFAIMDFIADKRTAFEFDMEQKVLESEKARMELEKLRLEHQHAIHQHKQIA